MSHDDFDQYRRLLLDNIEELKTSNRQTAESLNQIKVEIALLKQKAGVWGLLAGAIPVVILLLIEAVKK